MMDPTYEREIQEWRARRLAALKRPDGWLSLVGLTWLHEGTNSVGGGPDDTVVLPGARVPPRIGTLEVRDGSVTARFDPRVGVRHDGYPVTTMRLIHDGEGSPTTLTLGTLTFHVIRRGGELAVRIRDSEAPGRRQIHGIASFPIDPRWRIAGTFERYDPPRSSAVPTVVGRDETYLVPGAISFRHEGAAHRLETFLETGESDLFIIFGDATNGKETYSGGRYVYARPASEGGAVVVDFNKAYNPPCVFTPFATCALPLPRNRLPFRVTAGEKVHRASKALP